MKQCYTTMLVAVVSKDKIRAARLGDGFIGIYADEKLVCLFDNKNEYFINETDCLHEFFDIDKVEILEMEYKNLNGIISCTDGIEVRTMQEDDLIDFTKEFIDEYRTLNLNQIVDDVEKWLSDWTSHDDKTIAFLIENS